MTTTLLDRFAVELTLTSTIKRGDNAAVSEAIPVQVREEIVVSDSAAHAKTAALALTPDGYGGKTYTQLGYAVTRVTTEQENGPNSGKDANGVQLEGSSQFLPVIPPAPFGGAANYHLN